jgi:hypothetical protein
VSRRRRNQPSDKLDAALDGRPVEVDDDLAPLIKTAARLRAALAAIELDPQAAERHLGTVLDNQAKVVALPTRPRPQVGRWRRRVAAVALAAALTVLPATMASASASALPGQALFPVKLAVEQLRVTAVSWSSTWEADWRIRITDHRLDELDRLVQLHAADRIPPAIVRLRQAHVDAQRAVEDAVQNSGDPSQARALHGKLAAVRAGSAVALQRLQVKLDQGMLPASARQAITDAIQQAPVTPGLVQGTPQPTSTTAAPMVATPTGPTTTLAPTTTQVPTTTALAPTTTQVPTTTQPPTTTTVAPEVSDSPDQGGNDVSGQGSSGQAATTLP